MPFDQQSRQGDDVFRLGAVEADRFDRSRTRSSPSAAILAGVSAVRERRSRLIDPNEREERVFGEFGLGFGLSCETRKISSMRAFSGRRPPTARGFRAALTVCFRHGRVITQNLGDKAGGKCPTPSSGKFTKRG
jgi:hypothetical protein